MLLGNKYINKNSSEDLSSEAQSKDGYKHAKLGWIPKDWSVEKVSDIFDLLSTNSFSRNQMHYEITEECIYNIHYGDIHATYKKPILDFDIEKSVPVISNNVVLSSSPTYLNDGDVIIADASEDYEGVGQAIELKNLNGRKVLAGLHTFALRDKSSSTNAGFRAYIFKNPKVSKAIKVIATGSKVYGISKANLEKFELVLPPLPEQQKIAQILSTWDKAIAKTEQLIAKKQERKKGLMQQLLTGKKRFSEFSNDDERKKLLRIPKGLKNLYGGTIPKNWNQIKLEDLASIKYGISTPLNRALNDGTLIISLPNVNVEGELILDDVPFIENDKVKDVDILTYGDLLFNWRNGSAKHIGKTAFFDLSGRYTHVGFLLRIRISSNLDPFYLYTFLNFIRKRGYFTKSKIQVNNSFNKEELSDLEVVFPSEKEQQKIVSVLSSADREITSLQNQLAKLKEQKKGLMQKLLTGEVRVKI